MSQEIIYTSAQKGLKPGSRGFCTVVSTAGMAKNLADRLESLSGYRHQFQPGDESENPVNFSHVCMTVGGQKYHVLSRIADAGLDYTQRTNKIAHHVAISVNEIASSPGGPAWVLSEGLCVTEWDGQVKTVHQSYSRPAATPCSLEKCVHWQLVTGDAGWGGVLAETALGKGHPISVIFPLGTDTLALVRESMSLLSEEDRWRVTFSTYFTKLPAGVDCLWRFVLDGTRDTTALRNNPHARVIDLCDPQLGNAPNGKLVSAARTGEITVAVQDVSSKSMASPAVKIPAASLPRADARRSNTPTSCSDVAASPQLVLRPSARSSASATRIAIVAVAVSLLIIVSFGVVAAYLARQTRPVIASKQTADRSVPDEVDDQLQIPSAVEAPDANDFLSEETRRSLDEIKREQELAKLEQDKAGDQENQSIEMVPPNDVDEPKGPEARLQPFRDVGQKDRRLSLPRRPRIRTSEFTELVRLFASDPSTCDISLEGDALEAEGLEVRIENAMRNGGKQWLISQKTIAGGGFWDEVATFQLKDDVFGFRWEKGGLPLHYCLLDITVDGQTEQFSLNSPREINPIQLTFEDGLQFVDLPIERESGSSLLMDLSFEGSGFGEVSAPIHALEPDGEAMVTIPHPTSLANDKSIRIDVRFEVDSPTPGIRFIPSTEAIYLRTNLNTYEDLIVLNDDLTPEVPENEQEDPEKEKKAPEHRKDDPMPFAIKEERFSLSYATLQKISALCKRDLKRVERFKRQNEGRREAMERMRKGKGKEIENIQRDRTRLLTNSAKNLDGEIDPKSILGRQIKQIDRNIMSVRKEIDEINQNIKTNREIGKLIDKLANFNKRTQDWVDSATHLATRLHDDGRIQVRIYAKVSDVEVNVVRTSHQPGAIDGIRE